MQGDALFDAGFKPSNESAMQWLRGYYQQRIGHMGVEVRRRSKQ